MVARIAVLEAKLEKLLLTLKQNREQVPLETLKTYYAKPYHDLTEDIKTTLIDYVKSVVCNGLPVSAADQD